MTAVHVPMKSRDKSALDLVVAGVTEGLDAVVTHAGPSEDYGQGFVELRVEGNPRDLATALERAEKLGGLQ